MYSMVSDSNDVHLSSLLEELRDFVPYDVRSTMRLIRSTRAFCSGWMQGCTPVAVANDDFFPQQSSWNQSNMNCANNNITLSRLSEYYSIHEHDLIATLLGGEGGNTTTNDNEIRTRFNGKSELEVVFAYGWVRGRNIRAFQLLV